MVVLRSPPRKPPRRPSLESQGDAAAPAPLAASSPPGEGNQQNSLLHMQAPSASSTSPEKPLLPSSHARLVAQTLAHVAESPNLKRNTEWPFASSSKLRRSPPRAFVSSIPVLAKQQQEQTLQPASPRTVAPDDIRPLEPEHPASNNNNTVDATLHSAPDASAGPPLDTTHAASPGPARSNAARMSTVGRHARTSLPSSLGTPARIASPSSPVSVRAVAKIGRLTAQIAQLDSALSMTSAELAAVQAKHASVSERLADALAEGQKVQEELEGHKSIAGDCEAILTEYEENKVVISELERLRETDALELAELQEHHTRLKWRERKVRCELASRRQEGKWREAEEHTDELRELRLAAVALRATVIELERQLGCTRFELACERATSEAYRAEADRLLAQRREILLVVRDERGRMAAQAEQIATHHGERTELIARLDDAIRSSAHLEKDNKVIEKQLKLFEEAEREHDQEAEQHQLVRSRLKEVEKQVKALERDNAQLIKSTAALEQELADARADAVLASKKLRETERRFRSAEEERKNLQGSFDMQQRASRAFGSASASQSVAPASPGTGRLARSEAAPPVEKEEPPDQISEEEEEESMRLPPPLKSASTAPDAKAEAGHIAREAARRRGKNAKAGEAVELDSEGSDDAPPARKPTKAATIKNAKGGATSAKGGKGKSRAKGVPAASEDEGNDHNTGSDQDKEQAEEAFPKRVATKSQRPIASAARKTAPAAGKRKRAEDTSPASEEEADNASDIGGLDAQEVQPMVKTVKKSKDKNEVVQTVKKAVALTTVTTSGSGSGSTSAAPSRKRINLSGKTGSAFHWGGLGAGSLSGGGGNILGIPDVLSPIKKSR